MVAFCIILTPTIKGKHSNREKRKVLLNGDHKMVKFTVFNLGTIITVNAYAKVFMISQSM